MWAPWLLVVYRCERQVVLLCVQYDKEGTEGDYPLCDGTDVLTTYI